MRKKVENPLILPVLWRQFWGNLLLIEFSLTSKMKTVQVLLTVGTLASTAIAGLPLVQSVRVLYKLSSAKNILTLQQNQLRRVLLRSELKAKAEKLLSFAEDNTRVIGSPGFNKTVNWVYDTIKSFGDYYTVEYQPFSVPSGNGSLSINGKSYVADYMTYSPSGHVVAPVVLVNDIGCVLVSWNSFNTGSMLLLT